MKIRRQRMKTADDFLNVDLQMKCSCENASIQFSQRFLQCRSSMPIGIFRTFIQTILCLSPKIRICIFDVDNRMLKDFQRLSSLRSTSSISTNFHIPLRFTLINLITDVPNCSCLTSTSDIFRSNPIEKENFDEILSTFDRPVKHNVIDIPTPPDSSNDVVLSESLINKITTEFGEICSSIDRPVDLSLKGFCTNI